LELFKGTGSVGKAGKQIGFSIVSLDYDPVYKPDIQTDILNWDYEQYLKTHNYIPDYIWASPPCNTFSPLAYRLKERDPNTAKPKSERAKEGTAILYKTLEIIRFFIKLNPNLLFCIENPHGMMRKDKKMKQIPFMTSVTYCSYGDTKRKLTDFWSNYPLELKKPGQDCSSSLKGVVDLKLTDRYSIPAKLIKTIIIQSYYECDCETSSSCQCDK
jgi:site-specific DNA-cytosine methylase